MNRISQIYLLKAAILTFSLLSISGAGVKAARATQTPERLACLTPALAQWTHKLGKKKHSCVAVPDFAGVQVDSQTLGLGNYRNLNFELLVKSKPDRILYDSSMNRMDQIHRIEAFFSKQKMIDIRASHLSELPQLKQSLSSVFGDLPNSIVPEISEVKSVLGQGVRKMQSPILILVGVSPFIAASPRSLLGEIFQEMRFKNALSSHLEYVPILPEVFAAQPLPYVVSFEMSDGLKLKNYEEQLEKFNLGKRYLHLPASENVLSFRPEWWQAVKTMKAYLDKHFNSPIGS